MDFYQARKPQLLQLSNVLLRVPSIFILELLYNSTSRKILKGDVLGHSPSRFISECGFNPDSVTVGVQYVGYVVAFLLHALPVSKLLELYRHILVGVLLVTCHYVSSYFISWEHSDQTTLEQDFEGRSTLRLLVFLGIQSFLVVLCGLLTRTWACGPYMYLLPVVTRLLNVPLDVAEMYHAIAKTFVLGGASIFILTNVLVPYRLALKGLQTMQAYVQLYGVVSVIFAVYNRFFVPTVYLIFWFSMFAYHLYVYFFTKSSPTVFEEKWTILLLTAVADCCMSPWSLIGLCFTVSYGAFATLAFCKVYLKGFRRVNADNDFLRQGWTEGVTLLLLALQTDLLQLKTHEKVLLLSVVLFIVMSSTIQSIYELTDPILLSLGVSNNRNMSTHIRVLAMCLLLFSTPLYMGYTVIYYFKVELWLMIIISSCALTSVQTAASVMIYLLFMLDHRKKVPSESLDDVVYGIHALCHFAEFTIAIFVLVYGSWESMNGGYNFVGTTIIAMHSYFNVWQRGHNGWNSFLLRMEASKKVNSLPKADPEELQDVCAICYEEMACACVTQCRHYFHNVCLRKWLYVQTTCPMCHATISQKRSGSGHGGNAADDTGGSRRNVEVESVEHDVMEADEKYGDAAVCVCNCCDVK